MLLFCINIIKNSAFACSCFSVYDALNSSEPYILFLFVTYYLIYVDKWNLTLFLDSQMSSTYKYLYMFVVWVKYKFFLNHYSDDSITYFGYWSILM